MGAGSKCPSCKRWSSCSCSNCKDNPIYGPLHEWDKEGESIKCPHCGIVDSADAWEEEVWKDYDEEQELKENEESKS